MNGKNQSNENDLVDYYMISDELSEMFDELFDQDDPEDEPDLAGQKKKEKKIKVEPNQSILDYRRIADRYTYPEELHPLGLVKWIADSVNDQRIKIKNMEELMELYPDLEGCYLTEKGRLKTHKIADHMIIVYDLMTIAEMKKIYTYHKGRYHEYMPHGRDIPIEDYIRHRLEIIYPVISDHYKSAVINKIKDRTAVTMKNIDTRGDLINFNNGVLNIRTKELLPHSKNYYFTTQLDFGYDPEATCPEFISAISQHVRNEDLDNIQELLGLLLVDDPPLKNIFVLTGPPNTMKTFTALLFSQIIGEDRTSTYSVAELYNNGFKMSNLHGVRFIFDDEMMSYSDIKKMQGFMTKLSGGAWLQGDLKHVQGKTQIKGNKIILFTANELPNMKLGSGFVDRLMIVKFFNQIERKDQDPGFLKKLFEKEAPGIINFGIEGLDRYLDNNMTFSYIMENEEKEELWQKEADPHGYIIRGMIEVTYNEEDYVSREDLYSRYKMYLSLLDSSQTPIHRSAFFKKVYNILDFYGVDKEKARYYPIIDGEQIHSLKYIKIKEEKYILSNVI